MDQMAQCTVKTLQWVKTCLVPENPLDPRLKDVTTEVWFGHHVNLSKIK